MFKERTTLSFYVPRNKEELVKMLHKEFPKTSKWYWEKKKIKQLYAVFYSIRRKQALVY